MTDDRLRRCAIHGPELRAYVEALVKAEAERAVEPVEPEGEEIHDDDDGGWDED
jgi:hypothetical protein